MSTEMSAEPSPDSQAGALPDAAYVEANRDVATRVVRRLGRSSVLADGATADAETCRVEAEKIRDFLNMELPNIRGGGPLDDSFKRMRRSARDFVRAAGPGAQTFRSDPAHFEACLTAMRITVGEECAALAQRFGVAQ
jgi:hypothetical protein